ncbi:hypothetical protein A1OE_1100 [Candidatus Endolissoclinum faulkneri L2]|uniref:Uncharacterized protein n=1 Tax=Candidatus Endolissoclinum faulkneri L2 TaxID=1193729 RepID=K7Z5F1_9PROT|nr:hypothetical protein A1OE_1100 [Candidatus Endolissoclinum faulkneri L2]
MYMIHTCPLENARKFMYSNLPIYKICFFSLIMKRQIL